MDKSLSQQTELFCVANERMKQMGLQAHPYQLQAFDNVNSWGSMRQFITNQPPSRL